MAWRKQRLFPRGLFAVAGLGRGSYCGLSTELMPLPQQPLCHKQKLPDGRILITRWSSQFIFVVDVQFIRMCGCVCSHIMELWFCFTLYSRVYGWSWLYVWSCVWQLKFPVCSSLYLRVSGNCCDLEWEHIASRRECCDPTATSKGGSPSFLNYLCCNTWT